MRRIGIAAVIAVAAMGCGQEPVETDCDAVCHELVYTCDYAAFPSFESCVQGCSHNSTEGADITAQRQCIEDAACDTFAIVECEHTYGVE